MIYVLADAGCRRASLDAGRGEVFTRAIEQMFENNRLRMMLEVLL